MAPNTQLQSQSQCAHAWIYMCMGPSLSANHMGVCTDLHAHAQSLGNKGGRGAFL